MEGNVVNGKTIQFADDGLYYGSEPDEVGARVALLTGEDLKPTGICLADKKGAVGYVKSGGRWLKPLTFLGVTYHPNSDLLENKSGEFMSREVLLAKPSYLDKFCGRTYGVADRVE